MASEIDKFANQAYELLYGMETVGDITKVDAEDVPDHDILTAGFPCFAKGTLVTTSDGLKPIEKIGTGDKVLTHTNMFKSVVVPMKKFKRGIYELKVQGSPSTLITEEHPVYVREMYRTYPTVNGKRTNKRNWTEPKWVKAKDLKKGDHFIGMSQSNISDNPRKITKEDAWLIGRYVADGYIRNGRRRGRENSYNTQVIYCVGKDKLKKFKENVNSYYLGITEERTVYKVRIINKRLMDLCLEAGRGSENKKIPGFILDLPNDILEIFLEGYLSGDGSKGKGGYAATSVSRVLIYGLGQVVQKLYQTPYSIQYCKRPKTATIEGRTVNQRDTWTIRFRKERRKQQDGIYIDGMLWMPVRSITYNQNFGDYVYNFEVEGDNSYVANNLTVHNCQAFSVAGKRLGFEDTRGTLFFEIVRIAHTKKPKVLLLENVKGLINHGKGETFNTMVQVLCDIGYTVDFEVLNSKYFGVPQNRERVFIVAIRDDLVTPEPWTSIEGNTVVPKGKRRIQELEGVKTFNFDWPPQEQVTKRLRDILEDNVDERFYLSEEKTVKLVEQLSAKEGLQQTGYIEKNMQGNRVYDANGVGATVASQTGGLGGRGVSLVKDTPDMLGLLDMKGNESIRRVDSADGVSPTLTTMEGGYREPKIAELQQFSSGEGVSHAIDANYAKGTSPGDVGKGRRTHVIEAEVVRPVLTPDRMEKRQNGRRFKEDGEPMFMLTGQDRHGIAIREATKKGYAVACEGDAVNIQFPDSKTRRGRVGRQIANTLEASSVNQGVVTPKYRIRKLTPLECFRLQAFPDEYHEILSANGISNSQLYKMAGNAVTVSVVEAIGRRLIPYLERRATP